MRVGWLGKIFKKSKKASYPIKEQAVNKQNYLHKENNPDRVYFSSESPCLKKWCNAQMKSNKDNRW
jgi:hypothetical protein